MTAMFWDPDLWGDGQPDIGHSSSALPNITSVTAIVIRGSFYIRPLSSSSVINSFKLISCGLHDAKTVDKSLKFTQYEVSDAKRMQGLYQKQGTETL
jgi:hypothetical protein